MKKTILLASAILLLAQLPAFAQLSLLSTSKTPRADRSEQPTVINADAMDIDIANDKATFMGNVLVDDPEMTLTCRKMTIYLENEPKKEEPKKTSPEKSGKKETAPIKNDLANAKPAPAKKESAEDDPVAGKRLARIVCTDDVVITRKLPLANGEEQKALAGKAVYNFTEGTIELTDKPVVVKGKSRVQGEKITLHTDSERITIVGAIATTTDFDSSKMKK